MSVFSITWTSAFEALFSSPDSPFEDILSLPECSPADSRQWKLYINLVTSDGGGIPFIEGYYFGIQASTGHISVGLQDHRWFAVDTDQHMVAEELVISTKVLATARTKDSVTFTGLFCSRGFLFHASGPPRIRTSFCARLRIADFMFPAGEYHSATEGVIKCIQMKPVLVPLTILAKLNSM